MKKILVTGGAGYIGSHAVVELANAGYDPVIIDNFCNSDRSVLQGIKRIIGKDIKCHEGDCTDVEFVDSIFCIEKDIKGVIHFAAIKSVDESFEKPEEYYRNNVGSTEVLLKVMKKHDVTELVFSSSACVYGQPDKLPAIEESPIKPTESPYGNTKQVCEKIIEGFVKNNGLMKAISLRYFNPIGAHQSGEIGELPLGRPNNLIPFITQVAVGLIDKLTIFGNDYNTPDGTCVRDYLHVVDLAKAHVKAFAFIESHQHGPFYDVFNLGTGKGNSVLAIVESFQKINNIKLNYVIGNRRAGDIDSLYANVDKANDILKWKTELSMEDALIDAWRWQKNITK